LRKERVDEKECELRGEESKGKESRGERVEGRAKEQARRMYVASWGRSLDALNPSRRTLVSFLFCPLRSSPQHHGTRQLSKFPPSNHPHTNGQQHGLPLPALVLMLFPSFSWLSRSELSSSTVGLGWKGPEGALPTRSSVVPSGQAPCGAVRFFTALPR
jgi:hypothetical protein